MQFFWTAKALPELSGMSAAQRKRAFRACQFKCFKEGRTWAVLFAIVVLTGSVFYFSVTTQPEPYATIFIALAGGLGGLVFGHYQMYRTRPYLREYIAREGERMARDSANTGQPQNPPSADQPAADGLA